MTGLFPASFRDDPELLVLLELALPFVERFERLEKETSQVSIELTPLE